MKIPHQKPQSPHRHFRKESKSQASAQLANAYETFVRMGEAYALEHGREMLIAGIAALVDISEAMLLGEYLCDACAAKQKSEEGSAPVN